MALNRRYRVLGVWLKIVAILIPVLVYLGASYVLMRTTPRSQWGERVEKPERVGRSR